jgi:hypothetical protein
VKLLRNLLKKKAEIPTHSTEEVLRFLRRFVVKSLRRLE